MYILYNMEHSVTLAGCSPSVFRSLVSRLLHFTSLNSTQSCTKIARPLQNIFIMWLCFRFTLKRGGKLFVSSFA